MSVKDVVDELFQKGEISYLAKKKLYKQLDIDPYRHREMAGDRGKPAHDIMREAEG